MYAYIIVICYLKHVHTDIFFLWIAAGTNVTEETIDKVLESCPDSGGDPLVVTPAETQG